MEKHSIAGICIDADKVLIAHRNPTGQMGGRWEFPGGKVEPGETDEQALIREFQEEFGVSVRVGEAVTTSSFEHDGTTFTLHAYRVFMPHKGDAVKYTLTEHTGYVWTPVDSINGLRFVDSDMRIYPQVRGYVHNLKESAQ